MKGYTERANGMICKDFKLTVTLPEDSVKALMSRAGKKQREAEIELRNFALWRLVDIKFNGLFISNDGKLGTGKDFKRNPDIWTAINSPMIKYV